MNARRSGIGIGSMLGLAMVLAGCTEGEVRPAEGLSDDARSEELRTEEEGETAVHQRHFIVVSDAKSPSPAQIHAHLDKTWQTFHDLFGVEPASVRVVLSAAPEGAPAQSQADQPRDTSGDTAGVHVIAWILRRDEDLGGQSFSDLSHEIAHMYFLDVMGNPGGLHQEHAWLHEAVACYHEGEPFLANRREWMRTHVGDRIPLDRLFEMQNPVKLNPLVEMTTQLHEQLAKGEITVTELNQKISAYAASHTDDLVKAGALNMTYYSESLSIFEFLLEREGTAFIRTMAKRLRDGDRMDAIIRESNQFQGIEPLEEAWLRWVEARAQP
jgi:hypothetical protein